MNALCRTKFLLVLTLAFAAASGSAAQGSGPRNWRWLFQLTGDFHYSQSDADFLPNTNYSLLFGNGGVGSLAIGKMLGKRIYLGARYEYWYAQRSISAAGISENNRLDYHSAGLEAGFRGGNARAFWMVSAAVAYPVKLSLYSSLGNPYTSTSTPLAYEGRGTLGLRLNSHFSVLFVAGYRLIDLGDLHNPASFLNGTTFNLSGAFGGAGIGLTF